MRLTDRQDSMLFAAAKQGGNLRVHELSTRRDWHVVGLMYAADDRFDVELLVAVGHLVRTHDLPRSTYRLTATGYRAAWNVPN
ncbi:MAG TPA: hypothetical protein VJ826_13930 [Candidatus Polarisedimenticolaceae bacterium]|nr:hypothetical protein [Candidatus Polarisedimenticolaceae bacterium]